MPKNKPADGAKGHLQKVKTHTRTAKEAAQCMFSAAGTAVDTTMTENTMEEASELMQDISKKSDMEIDEQKKRE